MTSTEPVVDHAPPPEAIDLLRALGFFTFTLDEEEEAA